MADEVRVSSSNPDGGNGFQLDLREKKLGLTGPNVALLLLICIIGIVAYLRTGTINTTMQEGQAQLAATEERVHRRVSDLFVRLDKLVDDVAAQNVVLTQNNAKITTGLHELRTHIDDALKGQTALVHTQTEAIAGLVHKQTEYIEAWFSEMGKRAEVHNHNTLYPDRALPLRSPLPPEEHHVPRGR